MRAEKSKMENQTECCLEHLYKYKRFQHLMRRSALIRKKSDRFSFYIDLFRSLFSYKQQN